MLIETCIASIRRAYHTTYPTLNAESTADVTDLDSPEE